jgi:hypothetical protein
MLGSELVGTFNIYSRVERHHFSAILMYCANILNLAWFDPGISD